ncbi:MAG: NAD-dependent succinate-semialdehyde dehydrogenase [Legionellaceae bacterium]
MTIQTINPATGACINAYPLLKADQLIKAITNTQQAFHGWKKTSFVMRSELMHEAALLLRQHKNTYAHLMAQEMGKPIAAGALEIEKCATVCEHYATHTADYLASQTLKSEQKTSIVTYQPLGIVFGIMPWNFPFWQVFRFAVPTLMAGNAVLLKHAPITTGSGLMIQALFEEAGFPPSLFQTLLIDIPSAADVIAHDDVAAVTFTGSTNAGRTIASAAGQHLKKVVLELGGNDPYLVLHDADLKHAAACLVTSRLNNAGQSCIAAKRIIVVESVMDDFMQHLEKEMDRYTLGDPINPNTTLGPMAREDLRATLHDQVMRSQDQGARLVLGGVLPEGPGFYYPKTLLTHVKPGMPAFDEELFGPVLSIIQAKNEQEAIQLANQSRYGLGGGVFTQDIKRGEAIALHAIETGSCFINECVSSTPHLPFGGIKNSGYGRELSREGQLEFVNIKTMVIQQPLSTDSPG